MEKVPGVVTETTSLPHADQSRYMLASFRAPAPSYHPQNKRNDYSTDQRLKRAYSLQCHPETGQYVPINERQICYILLECWISNPTKYNKSIYQEWANMEVVTVIQNKALQLEIQGKSYYDPLGLMEAEEV